MEKMAQVFFILVSALIADQVECKPKFRSMPKYYDKSVTLKVKNVRRYYDYADMYWTTKGTASHVIKIDGDAKRYQKCSKGVLQQVQRMEEDGKVWTVCFLCDTSIKWRLNLVHLFIQCLHFVYLTLYSRNLLQQKELGKHFF